MEPKGVRHGLQIMNPSNVRSSPCILDETQCVLAWGTQAHLSQVLDALGPLVKVLGAVKRIGHSRQIEGVGPPCFDVMGDLDFSSIAQEGGGVYLSKSSGVRPAKSDSDNPRSGSPPLPPQVRNADPIHRRLGNHAGIL